MNFIKKLAGKENKNSSSCCGVEIKEVESKQEDSCCGTSNDKESSCC
jgi:hypothetical protein